VKHSDTQREWGHRKTSDILAAPHRFRAGASREKRRRLYLELVGADDERVALFRLSIQRPRAGEREGFTVALERSLVSG